MSVPQIPEQRVSGGIAPARVDSQSENEFATVDDRLIDVTRRFLHTKRREWNQTKLYTVDGHELGVAQIDALEAVALHGDMHMNQLATRLRLDPSTVTRAINPLVDMQLLERYTDPSNRRYVILRCMPAGKAAVGRFIEQRQRVMRETLEPMDPARRLLLVELFEEYTTLLEHNQAAREGAGPNSRRAAVTSTPAS